MAGALGGECGSGWTGGRASAVFRSVGGAPGGAAEVVVEQYARYSGRVSLVLLVVMIALAVWQSSRRRDDAQPE